MKFSVVLENDQIAEALTDYLKDQGFPVSSARSFLSVEEKNGHRIIFSTGGEYPSNTHQIPEPASEKECDHIADASKMMPSNTRQLFESDIFPLFGKQMVLEKYPDYRDVAHFIVVADMYNGQKQILKDFDVDFSEEQEDQPDEKPWLEILKWPDTSYCAAMEEDRSVYFHDIPSYCNGFPHWGAKSGGWFDNKRRASQRDYVVHGNLKWKDSLTMRPKE